MRAPTVDDVKTTLSVCASAQEASHSEFHLLLDQCSVPIGRLLHRHNSTGRLVEHRHNSTGRLVEHLKRIFVSGRQRLRLFPQRERQGLRTWAL